MSNDIKFTKIDTLNSYNFARLEENDEPYIKGFPIIFLTTPLLNLTKDNIINDSYFSYMSTNETELLSMLSFGINDSESYKSNSPFIKPLTNKFKTMDARDTTSRTKTLNETFYGHKMLLPSSLIESINGDEFSVTYTENSDLIITKLHKLWVEYTERIRRGDFRPSEATINGRYIDYFSTLYYFILDFDCETIKYYAKYTGIVPLNIPYSAYSSSVGDQGSLVELNVNYSYSYKEDMDPAILLDFNYVSKKIDKLVNLPEDEEELKLVKKDVLIAGDENNINNRLSQIGQYYYFNLEDQHYIDNFHESLSNKSKAEIVMSKLNSADKNYKFKLKFY